MPLPNGFSLDIILLRPIINIEVSDPSDGSNVQKFVPPLTMTAQFTTNDWKGFRHRPQSALYRSIL